MENNLKTTQQISTKKVMNIGCSMSICRNRYYLITLKTDNERILNKTDFDASDRPYKSILLPSSID